MAVKENTSFFKFNQALATHSVKITPKKQTKTRANQVGLAKAMGIFTKVIRIFKMHFIPYQQ